jgi:hypothetical protein
MTGPIIIVPVGDWKKYPEALLTFFKDYENYMRLSDSGNYHLVATSGELHNFFQLGKPSDNWRMVCKNPAESLGDIRQYAIVAKGAEYPVRMYAFCADLEDAKVQSELIQLGFVKLINLSKNQLADSKGLYQAVFHELFELAPIS